MAIYMNGTSVSNVYMNNSSVAEVYMNGTKVFPDGSTSVTYTVHVNWWEGSEDPEYYDRTFVGTFTYPAGSTYYSLYNSWYDVTDNYIRFRYNMDSGSSSSHGMSIECTYPNYTKWHKEYRTGTSLTWMVWSYGSSSTATPTSGYYDFGYN